MRSKAHPNPIEGSSAAAGWSRIESSEAGYMLLAVIFMVALVLLSLAIAAPKVAAAIQRDRELELVHRGEQYKRAIRLYYKKFGSYPSSIDQLEKTNNLRFLRQRYTDPLTGKDDWKLIRMGQAHVRPLGFFGQQLGVSAGVAGASPIGSGSTGAASSSFGGSSGGSSFGSSGSSSFGGTSGGSSFGSSSGSSFGSGQSGGGLMGSTGGTSAGTGGGLYAANPTDDGSGSATAGSSGGSSGGSFGSGASTTGTSATLGGGNTNNAGLGAGTSTTLGGAPVVGVMPPQTKATILEYKLKTHYNEWEFVYDPVEEQTAAGSILGGGSGNINGTGNSVNGPGSTTGTSTTLGGAGAGPSSSPFGSSGSSGSSGGGSQPSTTPP